MGFELQRSAFESAHPAAMAAASIPIVDWRRVESDREGFLADIQHALGDVGFMVLANAPGFEPEAQARTMAQARAFFGAADAVKASASIAHTPHMRGWDP